MLKTIAVPCCVTALVLASAAQLFADILYAPKVDYLCVEAELIVEGEYLEGNRVKIVHVFKPSKRLPAKATHLEVQSVDKHSRVSHLFTKKRGRQKKVIRTNKLVLFLKFNPLRKVWAPIYPPTGNEGLGSAGLFWYDEQTCYGYDNLFTSLDGYLLQPGSVKHAMSDRIPKDIQDMRSQIKTGLSNLRQWESILNLKDKDEKARRLARYLLPHTAPKGYRDAFRVKLRHAMAELSSHAVKPLMQVIQNARPDDWLDETVLILYDIGPPARPAVPLLCKLLTARKKKVSRYYILSALRTTGDPSAIPHIRPLLKDEDKQVAAAATQALQALGDPTKGKPGVRPE